MQGGLYMLRTMDLMSWQTQLRKGAAELVVLGLLSRGERYGLQVLEETGGAGGVLSEGSIYPLLNRLEREGKLVARWVMPDEARVPRKYYRLSKEGAALVAEMKAMWTDFSAFVSGMVEGKEDDDVTGAGGKLHSAA